MEIYSKVLSFTTEHGGKTSFAPHLNFSSQGLRHFVLFRVDNFARCRCITIIFKR